MNDCPLHVTEDELSRLRSCASVVVREWECPDGMRWAEMIDCGDADDMQMLAETPAIMIVPFGYKFWLKAVSVGELLGVPSENPDA